MRPQRSVKLILICIILFCISPWCCGGEPNKQNSLESLNSGSNDTMSVENVYNSSNDVYIDESYDLLRKGSFSSATQKIREVLKTDPKNGLALNNLGVLLAIKAEYETALSVFKRAKNFARDRKIGGTTCQVPVGNIECVTVVSAMHSPAYTGKVPPIFWKSDIDEVAVFVGEQFCVPLEYAYHDDPIVWSSGSVKAVRTKPPTSTITKSDGSIQTVPLIIYKKVHHPEKHRKVDGTENLYFLDIEIERNIANLQLLLDHEL